MNKNNFAYEKISSESSDSPRLRLLRQDEDDSPHRVTLRRGFSVIAKSPKLAILIVIPFVTMLVVIIMGGVVLSRTWKPSLSQITISTRIPPDFCGSSPAQAIAAGCMFEANNFAWQHPLCFNAEQEDDWRSGPWSSDLEFWEQHDENWNGVGRIPNELAFAGQIQMVWVNTLQHRRHCLHIWRKYVEAANERMPMDSWTVERGHVRHCMEIIRDFNNSWPDDRVSSKLTLKYPACEYGPVAINISPNTWTADQLRLHSP